MDAEECPGVRPQGLDGNNMRAHTHPPRVACFGCPRSLGQAGLGCRRGSGENVCPGGSRQDPIYWVVVNGQGKASSGRGSHTAASNTALS